MSKYPRRIKYAVSQRYANFTIIGESPPVISDADRKYTCWECLCDCGNKFITTTKQIQRGIRKSCGCLSKSNRYKDLGTRRVIHNVKFRGYKFSAQTRDILWSLTFEEFSILISSNCKYCGSEPSNLSKTPKHSLLVGGVDRVDNNGSYYTENCVPCCSICNRAKGILSVEEFEEWIAKLTQLRLPRL